MVCSFLLDDRDEYINCVFLTDGCFCGIVDLYKNQGSEKNKMKRGLTLLLSVALLMGLIGCRKTEDVKQEDSMIPVESSETMADDNTETEVDEPLLVYYVNQAGSGTIAQAYINWYKLQEGALEIETQAFNSAAELEEAIYGEDKPDVILLDKYTSGPVVNPFQWAKDGKIAGLSAYLAEDMTYDSENYIAGLMQAGKYGDEQYLIPLSVCGQFLMTNSDEIEVGALESLQNEYTMNMVLETMIADMQSHEGETGYYSQVPYSFSVSTVVQWMVECLEQTGALHVDRESKSVTVDQELFELTMEYFRETYEVANPFLMGQVNVMQMSYADLAGSSTVILGSNNMINTARYMSSACQQLLDQDAVLIPFEMAEGGYALNMNVYGMVGGASKQPEAAYQFLRTLMDFSHDQWEMIAMNDVIVSLSPVNKNEALALIESFESMSGGMYKIGKETFEREQLPAELAEQLRNVIDETSRVFYADAEVCNAIVPCVEEYFNGQTDDLAGVAEEIKAAIEAIL